ncbi:hypothetical protein Aperf_G00000011187 [Anoplocephala perfoliata]
MGLYDVGSALIRGEMDPSDSFAWNEYLEKTGGTPAAWECFKQSRIPPENLFSIDSLLEAVDQRIALNETPPLLPSTSTPAPFTAVPITSGSTPAGASTVEGGASTATPSPVPSPSIVTPRRRRFSVTGSGQQLRRFRSAPFSLARVIETAGPRLRVRLVGTDDRNDCWFLVDSDEIRPYPSNETLQPPFGYVYNHLVWSKTLRRTVEEGKAAPPECFARPPPDPECNLFKKGDKLEAVDRHNAQLICPATIGEVSGQHVLVSFDGWSGNFDYWTRYDSRDLFPCGWCKLAGHALQSPGPAAVQRLNLTPTKMPIAPPRSIDPCSAIPALPHLTAPRPNSLRVAARRSAPTRRKRLTLTGVRRQRVIRRSLPDCFLSEVGKGISCSPPSIKSPASPPTITIPPPPLPRLTVITTTREDGSPQTIIKTSTTTTTASGSTKSTPTYPSEIKASSNGTGGSPPSILLPPPMLKPSGDGDAEAPERKHKKSKKRKRHGSKESHHRHSGGCEFLHRSISFNDCVKPPKLVIRHRSGDFPGASTAELFVDTMDSSPPPPPLSAPFSTKFSSPHSLGSPSRRSPLNPCVSNKSGESQSLYQTETRLQTASHSTVSPASMDLGPCPLLNVHEWSTDDVYNYLISKDSSLNDVANLFRQQEIDGPALLLVDMDTMRTLLNMKIGPALKVDDILNRLKRGHL